MKILLLILFYQFFLIHTEKAQVSAYNQTLGLKFWDFSRISECDISNILSLTCGSVCDKYKSELQYIQVAYYSKDQYLSWLAYSNIDKIIYIQFRGSITLDNWLHDFDFLQDSYPESNEYPYPEQNIPCNDCKVHTAFYHAYLDLRPQLLEAINYVSEKSGCKKIQIVGYSLGAAIGTHCVLDLLTNAQLKSIYQTQGIYSMGCPRVGNKNFATYFDGIVPTSYRIVHHQDIIPHLPIEAMGYYHTQQEVWYTSDKNLDYVLCLSGEDPNCSDKEKILYYADHLAYFNEQFNEVYDQCSESNQF